MKDFVPVANGDKLTSYAEIPRDLDGEGISLGFTEVCAIHDLPTIMNSIDKGLVSVTEATRQPTAASLRTIATLLYGGDFYDNGVGSIKAFAWPMLLQASGLATLAGNRLQLSKSGTVALPQTPAKTLRTLWHRWQSNKLLDEFRRIDTVKGQTGKGKSGFTALANRRAPVQEALKNCPIGRWVDVDDLFRFMRASSMDFSIHRNLWNLYITHVEYGSLGYDGHHDWNLLQGRYVLCLLFEYAATLGMIDVAYTFPQRARNDFRRMWGSDDFDFFSRYDGLYYFKLNSLGAYCIGLTDTYTPPVPVQQELLKMQPNLELVAIARTLSPGDITMLDTYAARVSDVVWRLDQEKLLDAIENGRQLVSFTDWLRANSSPAWPDVVSQFLSDMETRTSVLQSTGTARMIKCTDVALATKIANDPETGRFCVLAGQRNLVVPIELENRFRTALRKFGYCLPKAGS
jgi:hypothetical protein